MARGSVVPRRQCYAQPAYRLQVGETEQPVALIRKEGKHCNQQQLWIHSVYVAALLGSGPATQTTHVVAHSDWSVKKVRRNMNSTAPSSLFGHERSCHHIPTLIEKWHAVGERDSTIAPGNSQKHFKTTRRHMFRGCCNVLRSLNICQWLLKATFWVWISMLCSTVVLRLHSWLHEA
jgi:hypothetical protein